MEYINSTRFDDHFIFEMTNHRLARFEIIRDPKKIYDGIKKEWLNPEGHYLDDDSVCWASADYKRIYEK